MAKNTEPSISQVVAILDHKRTKVGYVVAPHIGEDGRASVEIVARIAALYPVDGAGRLTVAVTDWGRPGATVYPPRQFIGRASGYGYDKRAAALDGATVGGVALGDHCTAAPTLDALLSATQDGYRGRWTPGPGNVAGDYVVPEWAAGLAGLRWRALGGAF